MVFEAEGRAGGKLRSVSHDGLIWDEGANTMVKIFCLQIGLTMSSYLQPIVMEVLLLCRLRVNRRSEVCLMTLDLEKSNNL